jgi:hypothetical protein
VNRIERDYLDQLLKKMEAEGLGFRVIYERWDEETAHNVTAAQALDALGACDEEWINVYRADKCIGQMFLVYDNCQDGAEVVCDFHVSLEKWIEPEER